MSSEKSYQELAKLSSFEERFEYLKLDGQVGQDTFGYDRYLNQALYSSPEWKRIRQKVILRDEGCDLGCSGRPINRRILIHHLNPITAQDIIERNPKIFDLDNLVCVSHITHNAIHYGDTDLLPKDLVERTPNDTRPWRQ